MGLDFGTLPGQTPLDESEKEGLRISSISTRGELDEFEQQNIEEAMFWLEGRSLKPELIFIEKFCRNLHKRMYGKVWSWAGDLRKTDKNLGINKWEIPGAVKALCDDVLFWISHETFSSDEIAIRFKHLLVSIHCFSNGNGRHSRLMADLISEKIFKTKPFSWGAANQDATLDARSLYLKAVKAADLGEFDLLISFARS